MANIQIQTGIDRLATLLQKINFFKFSFNGVNDTLQGHLNTLLNNVNSTIQPDSGRIDSIADIFSKTEVQDLITAAKQSINGSNATKTITDIEQVLTSLQAQIDAKINPHKPFETKNMDLSPTLSTIGNVELAKWPVPTTSDDGNTIIWQEGDFVDFRITAQKINGGQSFAYTFPLEARALSLSDPADLLFALTTGGTSTGSEEIITLNDEQPDANTGSVTFSSASQTAISNIPDGQRVRVDLEHTINGVLQKIELEAKFNDKDEQGNNKYKSISIGLNYAPRALKFHISPTGVEILRQGNGSIPNVVERQYLEPFKTKRISALTSTSGSLSTSEVYATFDHTANELTVATTGTLIDMNTIKLQTVFREGGGAVDTNSLQTQLTQEITDRQAGDNALSQTIQQIQNVLSGKADTDLNNVNVGVANNGKYIKVKADGALEYANLDLRFIESDIASLFTITDGLEDNKVSKQIGTTADADKYLRVNAFGEVILKDPELAGSLIGIFDITLTGTPSQKSAQIIAAKNALVPGYNPNDGDIALVGQAGQALELFVYATAPNAEFEAAGSAKLVDEDQWSVDTQAAQVYEWETPFTTIANLDAAYPKVFTQNGKTANHNKLEGDRAYVGTAPNLALYRWDGTQWQSIAGNIDIPVPTADGTYLIKKDGTTVTYLTLESQFKTETIYTDEDYTWEFVGNGTSINVNKARAGYANEFMLVVPNGYNGAGASMFSILPITYKIGNAENDDLSFRATINSNGFVSIDAAARPGIIYQKKLKTKTLKVLI